MASGRSMSRAVHWLLRRVQPEKYLKCIDVFVGHIGYLLDILDRLYIQEQPLVK